MSTAILRETFTRFLVGERGANRVLDPEVFGKKFGAVTALLGCRHGELTRPFGLGRSSYRSCLKCGARAPFDTETLVTSRKFYQPTVN